MQDISLAPFSLTRPQKVSWYFPEGPDHLALIPSKSLRKILRQADELCQNKGVTWELRPLTHDEYLFWLEFYVHRSEEQGHDVFAKPEWYEEKMREGTKVLGLFFWQESTFLGGGVISETPQKVTLAYKATTFLRLSGEPNANLGSLLDFFFQRYARTTGKRISSGTSRNAFGVYNTLGYLNFKLRLGYKPQPAENAEYTESFPESTHPAAFFAFTPESQELQSYLIAPQAEENEDISELKTRLPEIQTLQVNT